MKDKSEFYSTLMGFVVIAALIFVYFVGKGLVGYWNNQVSEAMFDYNHVTLNEACRKFDGYPEWKTKDVDNYDGGVEEVVVFYCELY